MTDSQFPGKRRSLRGLKGQQSVTEMFSAVAEKRKSEGEANGGPRLQDKKQKLEGEEKDAGQKLGKCSDKSNIRCLLLFCVCPFIEFIILIVYPIET